MRANWMRTGISVLVAFALSLAAVSTASASADHATGAAVGATHLASQDHDADQDHTSDANGDDADGNVENGRGPQPRRLDDSAAISELCSGVSDGTPSLEVLCNAYRILSDGLPANTLRGLARAIIVHADQVAPGWRGRLDGDADRGNGGSPIAICRRLANSGDATEHPALAARCRELLDEGVTSPAELCARLSESGGLDEHPRLAQLCERIAGGDDTRPQRGRGRGRGGDGDGTEGESPRRGRPAFQRPDGERPDGDGPDGERPGRGRGRGRGAAAGAALRAVGTVQ